MDTIKLVREFHDTFEVETPDKVTIDNPDVNLLRTNLLMEELSELSSALALRDPEEVLDALCDLQYVLSGAVIQLGFSEVFNEAFNRVHHSNMSKVCPNEDVAQHTIDHYMKRDNPDLANHPYAEYNPAPSGKGFIVKRIADGKVLKATTYKPVALYDLVE